MGVVILMGYNMTGLAGAFARTYRESDYDNTVRSECTVTHKNEPVMHTSKVSADRTINITINIDNNTSIDHLREIKEILKNL